MLFLKRQIASETLLGIWKIEESIEELYEMLDRKDWLQKVDQAKSISRKREMLATRVLLKELLGEEKLICYCDSGRPYLEDQSCQLSISHTRGYVAIALNKENLLGLDIEQISDKIFRVRDRVIGDRDSIDQDNEQIHLLLHWSAKEAMFKYLDLEGVDFRKNLHVEPFIPQQEGIFITSESRTENQQTFEAFYIVDKDFVLVCLGRVGL